MDVQNDHLLADALSKTILSESHRMGTFSFRRGVMLMLEPGQVVWRRNCYFFMYIWVKTAWVSHLHFSLAGLKDLSFLCECPAGFAGLRCETAYAGACQSAPCLNGGFCREDEDTFQFECLCPYPFFGNNCERSARTAGTYIITFWFFDSVKRFFYMYTT